MLPRIYARAPLSAELMGSLVETIAKIGFGDGPGEARDLLGRTYEYFIKEFARAEGHRGGEFFTPAPVARLLVEMLEPLEGRVFDPACGSCGLFVQSGAVRRGPRRPPGEISIYGQERNQATWRIGRMNLAIHGLSGEVKYTEGGSLLDDAFPTLKADFVMANPPFNQKEWSTPAILDDARWAHGTPPTGNANYAWIQHFLFHLAPKGRAGFVMANGSLTTMTGGEGKIRENLIRGRRRRLHRRAPRAAVLHDRHPGLSLVPRPRQGVTPASATAAARRCSSTRASWAARSAAHRSNSPTTRSSGSPLLTTAGGARAQASTPTSRASAVPRRCDEIEAAGFTLSPGRYVGAPESEEDEIAFEEKMAMLVDQLADEMAENERLAGEVKEALATSRLCRLPESRHRVAHASGDLLQNRRRASDQAVARIAPVTKADRPTRPGHRGPDDGTRLMAPIDHDNEVRITRLRSRWPATYSLPRKEAAWAGTALRVQPNCRASRVLACTPGYWRSLDGSGSIQIS